MMRGELIFIINGCPETSSPGLHGVCVEALAGMTGADASCCWFAADESRVSFGTGTGL
jgi:hypothetical protein